MQHPFPLDSVDSQHRVMFSCNFTCRAVYPVSNFEREMAKVITDNSLAILGTNLWYGPQVSIPDGDGPYIQLSSTGGRSSDWSHTSKYENLSFQVLVRGSDYDVTKTKIHNIYTLFNGLEKLTITV